MDKKILEVTLNILENLTYEIKGLKQNLCGNDELSCIENDISLLKKLISEEP